MQSKTRIMSDEELQRRTQATKAKLLSEYNCCICGSEGIPRHFGCHSWFADDIPRLSPCSASTCDLWYCASCVTQHRQRGRNCDCGFGVLGVPYATKLLSHATVETIACPSCKCPHGLVFQRTSTSDPPPKTAVPCRQCQQLCCLSCFALEEQCSCTKQSYSGWCRYVTPPVPWHVVNETSFLQSTSRQSRAVTRLARFSDEAPTVPCVTCGTGILRSAACLELTHCGATFCSVCGVRKLPWETTIGCHGDPSGTPCPHFSDDLATRFQVPKFRCRQHECTTVTKDCGRRDHRAGRLAMAKVLLRFQQYCIQSNVTAFLQQQAQSKQPSSQINRVSLGCPPS